MNKNLVWVVQIATIFLILQLIFFGLIYSLKLHIDKAINNQIGEIMLMEIERNLGVN